MNCIVGWVCIRAYALQWMTGAVWHLRLHLVYNLSCKGFILEKKKKRKAIGENLILPFPLAGHSVSWQSSMPGLGRKSIPCICHNGMMPQRLIRAEMKELFFLMLHSSMNILTVALFLQTSKHISAPLKCGASCNGQGSPHPYCLGNATSWPRISYGSFCWEENLVCNTHSVQMTWRLVSQSERGAEPIWQYRRTLWNQWDFVTFLFPNINSADFHFQKCSFFS